MAAGPAVATDGEPPPDAGSFRGKFAPLSDEVREALRSSGIRIEDLDPDVVGPRITAAKLARHRGLMGPVQPRWEVGFGRVTADTPCRNVGWKPGLRHSDFPCVKLIDSTLAYIVAARSYGPTLGTGGVGAQPTSEDLYRKVEHLSWSVIDATTGKPYFMDVSG